MAVNSVMLGSTWTFDPDAAQDFCNWLKDCHPQINKVTYNAQYSHFAVEGDKVQDNQVKYLMKLQEFTQKELARSLKAPRVHRTVQTSKVIEHPDKRANKPSATSSHILDQPIGESSDCKLSVIETWKSERECLGYSNSQMHIFKELGSLTKTEISLDVTTKTIEVSGEHRDDVQEALDRLTKLDAVMELVRRSRQNQSHHLSLPSNHSGNLRMIPFWKHTLAGTVANTATNDDWKRMSKMVALVPSKSNFQMSNSPVPVEASVESRYWDGYQFTEFGAKELYSTDTQPEVSVSSPSSMTKRSLPSNTSDAASIPKIEEKNIQLEPEKVDRVTEWVHHNHEKKAVDYLLFDTGVEKPERTSPEKPTVEQEVIPGLLKRRVKPTTQSPTKAPEQKEMAVQDSMDFWAPLTPQLHRTMAQKSINAASTGTKAESKQLTLEDCWRRIRTPVKMNAANKEAKNPKPKDADSGSKVGKAFVIVPTAPEKTSIETKNTQVEASKLAAIEAKKLLASDLGDKMSRKQFPSTISRDDAEQVAEVFRALQPSLTAATCFPGALQLEICIGLVALTPFPSHQQKDDGLLSVQDWYKVFRPRNKIPPPPFWIWSKLAVSGKDVDSIMDSRSSAKEQQRLFEDKLFDRGVVYEYHCQSRDGRPFLIILDQNGNASLEQPEIILASSTIHSPYTTWDLSATLKGSLNYRKGGNAKLDEAIDTFIKSIWLQPGKSINIYCNEPADGIFSVNQIFMKRWTRHRHVPRDKLSSSEHIMLKVTETQQFVIGRNLDCPMSIRGRISLHQRQLWVKKKQLWIEAAIMSEAIQPILASNSDLQLGQKTQKWEAVDLLGDEISTVAGADCCYDTNLVAKSIGTASFGNMLRLGKEILSSMDVEPLVD